MGHVMCGHPTPGVAQQVPRPLIAATGAAWLGHCAIHVLVNFPLSFPKLWYQENLPWRRSAPPILWTFSLPQSARSRSSARYTFPASTSEKKYYVSRSSSLRAIRTLKLFDKSRTLDCSLDNPPLASCEKLPKAFLCH